MSVECDRFGWVSDSVRKKMETESFVDCDPSHRSGYKVVWLDLETGEYWSEPGGPESRTVWRIGQISCRHERDKPLKICHRALHFSITSPIWCYFFFGQCDWPGLYEHGRYRRVPSLHGVRVPDACSKVVAELDTECVNKAHQLKRGADQLEFGEPLTGSWFDFKDDKVPARGVSVRLGLLHSFPITDTQLSFCLTDETIEPGQWFMPSIILSTDGICRWYRDGQPIMFLERQKPKHLKRWSSFIRFVKFTSVNGEIHHLPLLHRRCFEDGTPLQLECRRWTASIRERGGHISAYAVNFRKFIARDLPVADRLNDWLQEMFSALTFPHGSFCPWSSVVLLHTALDLPFTAVIFRLFPLTQHPSSHFQLCDFHALLDGQTLKADVIDQPYSVAAAMDSLSVDHLMALLTIDLAHFRNPTVFDTEKETIRSQLKDIHDPFGTIQMSMVRK